MHSTSGNHVFDVHNDPVTPSELLAFAGGIANAIDRQQLDPDQDPLILAVDDRDSALMLSTGDPNHPATLSQVDQLLAPRRRMIALVGITGWSPADDLPVTAAWALVAVGRGGVPGCLLVRRVVEDRTWMRTPAEQYPWFALSTMSSLRANLEQGAPLRLKTATSSELYRTPHEQPDPPVDDRGEV